MDKVLLPCGQGCGRPLCIDLQGAKTSPIAGINDVDIYIYIYIEYILQHGLGFRV